MFGGVHGQVGASDDVVDGPPLAVFRNADRGGNGEGWFQRSGKELPAGEAVFALRNYRKDEGYYTLFLRAEPGLAVVASEPLDDSPGWRPLGNGELVDLRLPSPASLFLSSAG